MRTVHAVDAGDNRGHQIQKRLVHLKVVHRTLSKSFRSRRSFISSPLWAPEVYDPTSSVESRFSPSFTWNADAGNLCCVDALYSTLVVAPRTPYFNEMRYG